MVIDMNDAQLHTLDQLRAFLNGTEAVGFTVFAGERYDFITRILRRFGYARLRRA
ncbi:MAG: integrase, partial [Betaproteobacteria bacterium]|nr:integrase [Betaproteobacteria bacterium]